MRPKCLAATGQE